MNTTLRNTNPASDQQVLDCAFDKDAILKIASEHIAGQFTRATAIHRIRRIEACGKNDSDAYLEAAENIINGPDEAATEHAQRPEPLDMADEYDAALSALEFEKTDTHTGTRWRIQPASMKYRQSVADDHTLIVAEQYNGPGEIDCYQPVGIGYHLAECLTIIATDFQSRSPDAGDLCPEAYALWVRDDRGKFVNTATITQA